MVFPKFLVFYARLQILAARINYCTYRSSHSLMISSVRRYWHWVIGNWRYLPV